MNRWLCLVRRLAIVAALSVGVFIGLDRSSHGQFPPDLKNLHLALYERDVEVGRVYRDVAGPQYVEHWVLYPGYSFDRAQRAGESLRIEVVAGASYRSVDEFLRAVPFPKGSQYVIAACQEFDSLPIGD